MHAEKRFLDPMCSEQVAAGGDKWSPKNPSSGNNIHRLAPERVNREYMRGKNGSSVWRSQGPARQGGRVHELSLG